MFSFFNLVCLLLVSVLINSNSSAANYSSSTEKANITKRGINGVLTDGVFPFVINQPSETGYTSPKLVANAIAAAKRASANVLIAQQQVQAAKENVLNQQRLASEKEASASLLTQKSEAAAAVQRSEAAAAAQSVVLAQQRLAAAKAAFAQQQKIAAAMESEAAAALQSSARAAALEIQRTENEASKYFNVHRNNAATVAYHVAATKDAALAPISWGNNHVPNLSTSYPWYPYNGASYFKGFDGPAVSPLLPGFVPPLAHSYPLTPTELKVKKITSWI